jgi:hypothetical protein
MSFTLVEAAKRTNDVLQKGIIEKLYNDSPILTRLPFETVVGNGLTYNVETTMPNAEFYDVGDTIEESTGTVTQATAVLKRIIGNADIDNFVKATTAKDNNLETETIAAKVKAVQWAYMDCFYYGTSTATKKFNGLHTLIADTTYNTVHAGTDTGSALSCAKLDEAIDMVTGGPDMIVSSKKMRRLMTVYKRTIGDKFPADKDSFGQLVQMYGDIPWYVDEFMVDTETASSGAYSAKTGGANTSIFLLKFDPRPKALMGLQLGNINAYPIGELNDKDANRYRVKWYASLMLQNIRTCAKVDGIAVGSAVTA